jgi:hypothetical protein
MKDFIKHKLRENLSNQICNIMTVNTYEEGIDLLIKILGKPEQNPEDWTKIEKPLSMWKEITTQIRQEVAEKGMSGDSEVDESDTWWAAIQSTFCK